jgi:hypothetical protein
MNSRKKKIKLKDSVLVQIRETGEAYVLDRRSYDIIRFTDLEAFVLKVLVNSKKTKGLSVEEIQQKLNQWQQAKRRQAVLPTLRRLAGLDVISGIKGTRIKAPMKGAGVIGALSIGTSVLISPPALGAYPTKDCIGPPSCTASGFSCNTYLAGKVGCITGTKQYYCAGNVCS